VVMHVHDEVETEVDSDQLQQVKKIMNTLPPWAIGLPIASDGWIGTRYRK